MPPTASKPTAAATIQAIQGVLRVAQDGRFGPLSGAALNRADPGTLRTIQGILGVPQDGIFGPVSRAALNRAIIAADSARVIHHGYASSFANPADLKDFKACKLTGKTDLACFRVGDNGIGKWGTDTTLPRPMCALPPEDWSFLPHPDGTLVEVKANGRTIICELRDSMPRRENIKNGCVIDLNPQSVADLGLKPPIRRMCSWKWHL